MHDALIVYLTFNLVELGAMADSNNIPYEVTDDTGGVKILDADGKEITPK